MNPKQRYTIVTASIGLLVAVGVIGCGGAGADAITNPFIGQYEGTLAGDMNAVLTANVDKKGKVSGTIDDGQVKQLSGTVSVVGIAEWDGTPSNPEGEISYVLDGSCDSNGCSGTWFGSTGLNGTWSSQKQ